MKIKNEYHFNPATPKVEVKPSVEEVTYLLENYFLTKADQATTDEEADNWDDLRHALYDGNTDNTITNFLAAAINWKLSL